MSMMSILLMGSSMKAIEINTLINILIMIEDNDDKAENEDREI